MKVNLSQYYLSLDATGFRDVPALEFKEIQMRLRLELAWNEFSSVAKHQSWRSKCAQEEMLTEVKAHIGENTGAGKTAGGNGASYRMQTHQNKPKLISFHNGLVEKNLHFICLMLRTVNSAFP